MANSNHPDFSKNGQHLNSGYYWGPLAEDQNWQCSYTDPVVSMYWCMKEIQEDVLGGCDLVSKTHYAFRLNKQPDDSHKIPLDKLLIP